MPRSRRNLRSFASLRAPEPPPTLLRVRFTTLCALACLSLVAPLTTACAGSTTPANAVATANQRLAGSWKLQSFAPAVQLDLPLQAVLGAEIGQLVISFGQGQFTATGPGVNFTGRYEVTSASSDQVQFVLYDPQNVGYHFSGQFAGNLLHFQSNDKPWVGFGALERA